MILGVQRSGWGFVQREPIKGRDQKFTKLMRVDEDDLVYRTITAFEAPSAVAGPDEAGLFVTPQTFPVFKIDASKLLPSYMRLLTTWPTFHDEMASRCSGTVLRRKTLSVGAFESIPILLPPLAEQRRIVDLIGSLDETIAAAEDVRSRLQAARSFALQAVFGASESVEVGTLLSRIEGGRSPKAKDVPPSGDEFGVLKVSSVTRLGFDPTESKTVNDVSIFADHHRVRGGDVLITRANTAALVGQVCLVTEDHPNLFLCDKTLRLCPAPGVPSAAVVAALNAPVARDQLSAAATGTSASMKNISQIDIRRVRVAWPEYPENVGRLDQQLLGTLVENDRTVNRLRTLRSNLLTALLSGEHEIPDSYDEFMGETS